MQKPAIVLLTVMLVILVGCEEVFPQPYDGPIETGDRLVVYMEAGLDVFTANTRKTKHYPASTVFDVVKVLKLNYGKVFVTEKDGVRFGLGEESVRKAIGGHRMYRISKKSVELGEQDVITLKEALDPDQNHQ